MTAPKKDYYRILGVGTKATQDEIKSAYRSLAKRYHPDRNRGDKRSAERFKEIGEAYSRLGDPVKRKEYDRMRRLGAFGIRTGAPTGSRPRPGTRTQTGPDPSYSFEDLQGGFGNISDLLSSLFGQGRPGTEREEGGASAPAKGDNVEYLLDIPFLTAARGGKVTVSLSLAEECAACKATGAAPGAGLEVCGECGGDGTVSFGQGKFAVKRPCPACLGRGKMPEKPCPECSGRGELRRKRRVRVEVPKGTDNGHKIRLPGRGERGRNGGAAGDLIVSLRVKPHRLFRRKGLDVTATVPVNVAQLTLGSRVKVKTPDGKSVIIRIPPGTQSGTKFRVRGRGIERGERRGDFYVELNVEIPAELTQDELEAMENFAAAAGMRH